MLSFDEALEALLDKATDFKCPTSETIMADNAVSRIISEAIVAKTSTPPFDNSAMDGFAFRLEDIKAGQTLPISQIVFAGTAPAPLQPNTAARIYTGAMMPEGADTVELQENTNYTKETVTFHQACKKGQHIRRTGEDIHAGDCIIEAGTRLLPAHIGLIASCGIESIKVFKPLVITLIASGDELVKPPQILNPGQIYNSNLPMLKAALENAEFKVISKQVEDELAATISALKASIATSDLIITTGGVSVGDADFVKSAIETLGEIDFWKVAMKPGKPLTFGQVSDQEKTIPVIGLPGNPVSAFASFTLFAQPFLYRLQGRILTTLPDVSYPIELLEPMSPKREEFMRVTLVNSGKGFVLKPYNHQGSGVLSSVANSTGFARIPKDTTTRSGELVQYLPFNALN